MTKKTLLICLAMMLTLTVFAAKKSVTVTDLRTERMTNPMSIDTPTPRLGWKIISDKKDVMQTEYHIIVASSAENANNLKGDLWDTTVNSDASQWIKYAGKALRSNTRCYWRVKINTTKGDSEWSDVASWNIGLLNEADWSGQWIGLDKAMPWDVEDVHSKLSSRYIRHEFDVNKQVKCATLYISGLGMYEAFINGRKVGNQVLAPAPTDYRKTVLYNAFDVTEMLTTKNAIGVVLGNGRYYTMQQNKKPYKIANFGYPKLRLNLVIEYTDGNKKVISSNDKWKLTADGPIRSNNEYDGEIYDANKELGAWSSVGYDDSKWSTAQRVAIPYGTLRGAMSENMTVLDSIKPKSIKKHGNSYILDFGQNMAGWIKVKLNGTTKGDSVKIQFAETLKEDGSLFTENLRNAYTTDYYVPTGKEKNRTWHPTFVYHGFRYAEVSGLKNPTSNNFIAEVVSDKLEKSGSFESNDTILNKVYNNVVWGILDNYKGMPIDCPQRDERQPWLGDRQRGCFGESFIFDNNTLYAKWARDITEAQREDGCIPDVAPAFWNYYSDNMTWPSTLPFTLEMMYNQFGDSEPLRKFYPNVKRWLEHMKYQYKRDGLMPRDKYGDWCVPPEDLTLIHAKDPQLNTDGTLIGTAYYYKMNKLMERFAKITGNDADIAEFAKEAAETKEAFNKKFLTCKPGTSTLPGHILNPDSTFYGNNTVTANLLPLAFGMIDDKYVSEEVKKNIVTTIITPNKGHMCCGVIGMQWLMHELNEMGRGDMAWMLATDKTYPSLGYMTERGATTIWELWNGDTANPWMNSRNHVMLIGDLVSWMYENVAGIKADETKPGFKHIIMKPNFAVDDMDDIKASYNSIYGEIKSSWKKDKGILTWNVTIPANTTATLYMPDNTTKEIGSGSYSFKVKLPVLDKAVVCNEFIYKYASFPQCHSISIEETKKGDLVATYFGGTRERNPDVCIWVSRKPKGSDTWTEPLMVADGVMCDTLRKACWNPVIYQNPNGELQIYFKIGVNVADWTGWMVRSHDGGKTWTKREPLQEGFLGPVKNKPIYNKGRLIAPTSIEKGGWRLYFEYSDDLGKTWKRTDYVKADKEVLAIQPTIIVLPDGRLEALSRTRSRKIGITYSSDNGLTWSDLKFIDTPNNNSGIDAVSLKGGGYAMVCNDYPIEKTKTKGARTPLSLMLSDDGVNWKHWITLEDSPISQYSYPSIIQSKDGNLHIVYTWRRLRPKYVEVKLNK